jgi:hypothetical protein
MAETRSRRQRPRPPWWVGLPRDELLDLRLCDLELSIEGTALEARVGRLHEDLARRGLRFRPHVWLSTDWFTPDGVIGFAIPFFLAHPRLARLEHAMMFEVEGAGHEECTKILRHEAGHALDNGYRLRRRRRWREVFGSPAEPYRDTYVPRTASRSFVQHLDMWYAQSHPLEDFAETFAVWLTPRAAWRQRYRGWPVLEKLEYVDALMQEIAESAPPVRSRARPDLLSRVRTTLREHYRDKQAFYRREPTSAYDRPLRQLFTDGGRRKSAAVFLTEHRVELRNRVADLSGQYRYVVDQVLKTLIVRCRELGLRLARGEQTTRLDAAVMLAVLSTRFSRGGRREFVR